MFSCSAVLFLTLVCASSMPMYAASVDLKPQIDILFDRGDWDRALMKLQQLPADQVDGTARELLAMAFLYTSSRLDTAGNIEEARTRATQLVTEGGAARFYVSRGRVFKPDAKYLVEATPGQLIVSKASVQFVPHEGLTDGAKTWTAQEIVDCGPNPRLGRDSGSFHLTTMSASSEDKTAYFRPLHFSAEESDLICSLVPRGQTAAPDSNDDKNKKKKGGK